MGVTLTPIISNGVVAPKALGDEWAVLSGITFTGNYAAGGEAELGTLLETIFKQVGRGAVQYIHVQGPGGFLFSWDKSVNKLLVFESAASGAAFKEFTAGAYSAALLTAGKYQLFALGR